ncbi:MAG: nickel/cobalt efflux protein RcnA [Burkholderiaceae bacterium]|jgi:ABC-type nickel/cobalt efflux system permease component RcnA|nr:nickel/cobalt efflux protein RcnA [Burkholderiaceae bacterium]
MTAFSAFLQQGNAWLFVPSAILLGALHGLEPGHSKTMMAAFIVAVGGTVGQAVLLGLSATVSHTAVVWAVAMAGLYFGRRWDAQTTEPYFQVISALLIVGVAVWMLWRTWKNQQLACAHNPHHQHHGDDEHGHDHDHDHGHPHDHKHHHGAIEGSRRLEIPASGGQDPHERAHANDIRRRFAHREVTTGQIVMFGLTGGLIPCPASITVLLLCLQLKKIALGATLVLCFSIGLALTLVAAGVLAALSVKHVAKRWNGFGAFARKAPYFSGALILLVGVYVGYSGMRALGWI